MPDRTGQADALGDSRPGTALPETMPAAYVDHLGPVEAIRVGELPVPHPGPGELLVAVEAAAVNPVDTFVRSGAFSTAVPLPLILGRDLVGTVVALGARTAGFAVGDRVWANSLGHGGRQGCSAAYAVVPAGRLYHLPEGVEPVTAVALAHPAATAWLGLHRHAQVQVGDVIFVGGGGGNVGDAVVRLACAAGLRVIASAAARDHDRVRAAGAEVVLDYRSPDLVEQLRAAAPSGLDVHWDTSGHHDLRAAVELSRRGGRVLLTAAGPHPEVALPVAAAYTKDVGLLGFVISNATGSDLAAAARAINTRLADGTLTRPRVEELPLSAAAQAHRRLEAGEVSGRQVLRIAPAS